LKRYLPKNAEDASALVLTLLVIVLLSATVVSFLSSTRTEQIATSNYTSKVKAEMFATTATQQAMAKIQQGFNTTGNGTGNFTSVITTQPGRITKYFFLNGNCTGNATEELFSGTGNVTTNGTANLNNLQNPGNSTSNATINQWTITGNASERINVPMQVVTSNGTVVGRIAYYVDDEGTKLNVNNATGNRSTLNVGVRPQDIAAIANATQTTSFLSLINNSTINNSSITGWSHFFRPEQVSAAIAGFSGNNTPFLATATTSASTTANMIHLLTPWGTQRIAINMLSTNATDGNGTASVSSIFEALTGLNATSVNGTYTASNSTYGITGRGLQNIFGGNFSTKYTPVGVQQIAANMLQMRSPNTFSVNASFGYNGSILCDELGLVPNPWDTSQLYIGIPGNYLANTPFPVINEIGCSSVHTYAGSELRVRVYNWIELFNPYDLPYTNTTNARLVYRLDKIQFKTTTTANNTIGIEKDFRRHQDNNMFPPTRWGGYSATIDGAGQGAQITSGDAIFPIPNIPARSTKTVFLEAQTNWRANVGVNSSSRITGNITACFERILLLANKDDPRSIRDAISGNDTRDFVFPTVFWNSSLANQPGPAPTPVITFKRLDARNKTTRNGTSGFIIYGNVTWNGTAAAIIDGNVTITKDTANGSAYQDNIAPAPDFTSGNAIPGDPILSNNSTYLLTSNSSADKRAPVLDFPAFSSPADLGKVPTNTLYRSLRMQMQPNKEVSPTYGGTGNQTFIPDWAMLDVISFGNSTDPNQPSNRFQPVNINGKFYLPSNATVSNTSPPAPRTIALKALAKVVEISANGTIQNPMDLMQNATLTTTDDVTRFKGAAGNATTIVNAIGNMTWSANSTWDTRRNTLRFPVDQYILPSEIMEIAGVADAVSQTEYNITTNGTSTSNSTSHFKWNEGRASALIPAVTTRSSFFTIYAYAQAGQLQNKTQPESANNPFIIDSEALSKTLVEVEIATTATSNGTTTTPAQYKVKKLYTQPISVGD